MYKLELKQTSFPFKTTTVKLNQERELEINYKSFSRANSLNLSISRITPRPSEFKNINYLVLGMFSLCIVVIVWASYTLYTVGSSEGLGKDALIAIFFSGGLSLYLATKLKNAYSHLLVYRDANTRETIFTISPTKPSQDVVQAFVDELENQAKAIAYPEGLTQADKTHIYVRHLDFLLQEGVLDANDYQKCLERISVMQKSRVVSLVKE